MYFFRDWRVASWYLLLSAPCSKPHVLQVHCGSLQLLHALPYLLHPCSRPRGGLLGLRPRPAGQPLAVVSATLRFLALIAMDDMYVCLFRLRAPTVGASL